MGQTRDPDTGQTFEDGAGSQFASATSDGAVTPSDTTPLDFNALCINEGVTATLVVSRDGGATSSPPYVATGPFILPVAGNRVMAAGTTITGAAGVNWMKW